MNTTDRVDPTNVLCRDATNNSFELQLHLERVGPYQFNSMMDQCSYPHHQRCDASPGEGPVHVWLPSGHLLNAGRELGRAEDPADGDGLEEAAPQDGNAAGAVEVHQLKGENNCYVTMWAVQRILTVVNSWFQGPNVIKHLWS